MMNFTHEIINDFHIFKVTGSLDIYTAVDLKSSIEETVKEPHSKLAVHMQNIKYIDSSGIGALIKVYNYMKNLNGVFYLVEVPAPQEKVFKVSGLLNYFKFLSEKDFAALIGTA